MKQKQTSKSSLDSVQGQLSFIIHDRKDEPPAAKKKEKVEEKEGVKAKEPPKPKVEVAAEETPPKPKASRKKKPRGRVTAESMASKQREISVSEFFTKNRHLLGFDNNAKALLTTVKEAVDNSLDACEEAGILPDIRVELIEVAEERYRVVIQDNGPGIVKAQIPKIFGKLLYGSKFHRMKQSRGQQGIGISAAGMYGQLTTGKAVVITSRTARHRPANQFEIVLNTQKNKPEVVEERELEWEMDHGTRVEIELQGTYRGGRRSVDEYLEQVVIANPHAELTYVPPKGRAPMHFPRAAVELPPEPNEIKPHPYGVELGALMKMLKESNQRWVTSALQHDFSRVSPMVAEKICDAAKVRPKASPRTLQLADIERLFKAIPKVKIMAPRTDCVVPIGEELIRKGLEREIEASFYASSTRPPSVYRGNAFRVEVGLAYGGALRARKDLDEHGEVLAVKAEDKAQGPITLIRFANRVPLQYQQGACSIFKAVIDSNWKGYGLAHPRGGLPMGPMVLIVHFASVWVPFTSESKEAVAHYPEIIKEIKLGIREVGRKLAAHLRRKEKARLEARRRSIFQLYIGELVHSLHALTGAAESRLQRNLDKMALKHTGGEKLAQEAGITPDRGVEVDTEAEPVENEGEDDEATMDAAAQAPRKKKAAAGKKKSPPKKKKAATRAEGK